MWWLQAEPRRPVAYVLGGWMGMDETHQSKIHFNWDNLSLFSLLSSLYPYSLLIYSSLRAECARLRPRFLPYVIFFLKTCIPFVAIPKKSKKRQAKTSLLKIRSTPIALAALPADFASSLIFQFSINNLSFRCGLSQKSRKNVKLKPCFWKFGAPLSHLRLFRLIFLSLRFLPYVQIFDAKPIIPLRAVPKKSKKRQSKTPLCHFSFWNLSFRS